MAAGKIICISFEQKHISVKQKRKERATLHNPLFVCKFRVLSEPYHRREHRRAVSGSQRSGCFRADRHRPGPVPDYLRGEIGRAHV